MPKKAKGTHETKQTPRRGHQSMNNSFTFEVEDSVPVNIPSFIHPRYTRHFGNHLPFYWKGDEPKFTIGPHCTYLIVIELIIPLGPIFVIIWLTSIGIMAVLISLVTVEENIPQVEFCLLSVATAWEALILLYAALKNPGIMSSRNSLEVDEEENQRNPPLVPLYCKICKVKEKRDCYHCSECEVCIKNYNYHSRWLGKCIGAGNRSPYRIFICSSVIYLILWIVVLCKSFLFKK